MEKFTFLAGTPTPMPEADIDTDIIFPARFLLVTAKKGLGRYAFYERRYKPDGGERPDFLLNQPGRTGAAILVAGDNFGCGSSREQAVWALHDLGVRCLISTRFGEIFQANCFKNGMLALTLSPELCARLMQDGKEARSVEVDLEEQIIRREDGEVIAFNLPEWTREALLNGWDEIALILRQDGEYITRFEDRQRALSPWLYTPMTLDGD
jgi:3-isopropylmalate dehydratase small subunit